MDVFDCICTALNVTEGTNEPCLMCKAAHGDSVQRSFWPHLLILFKSDGAEGDCLQLLHYSPVS